MILLRDLPVQRKLALITLAASLVALALACGTLFWFQFVTFRRGFADQLESLASITAYSSAAPLAFGDQKSGQEVLSVLRAKSSITGACLFDAKNQPFARFGPDRDWTKLAVTSDREVRFENGYAVLRFPINLDGARLGTLFIQARFAEQYRALVNIYIGLYAVVVAGSILVILMLSPILQRIVARPILSLAGVARAITEQQDYSVRAEELGKDEVGLLTTTFNRMLDQIQARDGSLRELNRTLEREVADRKQAEDALRESRERYEAAVAGSNDGIWDWKLDVNQTFLSPRSKEILGFADDEMQDDLQAWHARVHPEDAERTLVTLQEYLSGRLSNFEIEYRLQHKDGGYRWILSRGSALRDADGKPVRMAGSHTDITARKEMDAEVDKLHKQLLLTSRQAGMAEVATGVLHNVGNVLNSVNVSVNVLNEQLAKSQTGNLRKVCSLLEMHQSDLGDFLTADPKGKRLPVFLNELANLDEEEKGMLKTEMQTLVKNVEHIKEIVAMQQSYAKAAGLTEDLSVVGLIEDALQMNAGAFLRHSVTVRREFQQVPAVRVDRHKVLQILVNLFRNAKYALDEADPAQKTLNLGVAMNGNGRVKITVRDNGIGIPRENLTRIFGHGFTTKRDGHGFGLHSGALAAKEMGGSLHADSEGAGKGSIFVLELPVAENKTTQDQPA